MSLRFDSFVAVTTKQLAITIDTTAVASSSLVLTAAATIVVARLESELLAGCLLEKP